VASYFLTKSFLVPEGLETLPSQWLVALPGILNRWAPGKAIRLPFTIRRAALANGLLVFEFRGDVGDTISDFAEWDEVLVTVNRSVYPSRWRPLNNLDWVALRKSHPELRLSPHGLSPEI
jgi:hypothetical protein